MMPSEEERALEALLRSGRADPSGDDLERLERRLSPWLGAPPAAAPHGRIGATWKSIFFLAALGVLASSDVVRSASPSAAVPVAAPAASPASPAIATEKREAPVAAPTSEATVSVSDLPNAPAPVALEGVTRSPKSFAPPAGAAPQPTGAPEQPTGAPEQPAQVIESESEASFLRRAHSALGADPATALQMLEEHSSRYPHGILVQERDVMAIDALARLGRVEDARARARSFAARYPRSAHESRIASILKAGTP